MKIAVHFPTYKRYKEADMAAKALKRLLHEYEALGYTWEVYAAGTTERDIELCQSHGFTTIQVANTTAGHKFHTLAKHIYDNVDFDWFMEYCADNVCRPGYAQAVQDEIDKGADMVGTCSFHMATWHDSKIKTFTGGYSNVGRMTKGGYVHRAFRRYGMMYEPRYKKRLDQNWRKRVRALKGKIATVQMHDRGPWVLDVKTQLSMHGMNDYPSIPLVEGFVTLDGLFQEFEEIHQSWQPQQEKSGPTKSESTSATQPSPTQEQPHQEQPSGTTRLKTTRGNSSRAQRPAPSAGRSKSSTRRRKTTTGKGKSSPAD